MGNRCMEKSSLCVMGDECNYKSDNLTVDTMQNTSEVDQAWGSLESNVNSFNAVLFTDHSNMKEKAETSNQIDNSRLPFHPEVVLRPIEDNYPSETKRLCLDKDNDMTVISIYPTINNNFQDLLKYNTIHNRFGNFIHNSKCLNVNLNNQIPFIPMIYNASIHETTMPNYITINDCSNKIVKSEDIVMPQIVIAENCKESSSSPEVQKCIGDDDDVVFVKEYKIENSESNNEKRIEENQNAFKNKEDKNESMCSNRGRKRRGILIEKRKNPLRKAQMDKASIKLAENLSIPPAVFNARISSKKPKQVINNQKAVRQSCRTTGAILCPPSPLNQNDFKEWPTEGLHEIPWYNEQTDTIEKFNKNNSNANNKEIKAKQTSSGKNFFKVHPRSNQHNLLNYRTEQNKLSLLAHNRLHLSLDYINELKEFHNLTQSSKSSNNDLSEEPNSLDKVSTVLYDTCELYSLLNNTGILSVAKYIESLNVKTSSS